MSGAIRIAKAQYRGDPGIFSFVGKALGAVGGLVSKVVPGPIGMIAGAASKLLAGNGKPQNPSVTTAARALPQAAVNILSAGAGAMAVSRFADPLPPILQGSRPPQLPGQTQPSNGGIPGPVEWMKNQGVRFPDQATGGCPRGYHPNKTGYYTKQGYVAAGQACVRNRKRNPLNPRAASRAMARLTSAKKATKFLSAVSIRSEKGCGCK